MNGEEMVAKIRRQYTEDRIFEIVERFIKSGEHLGEGSRPAVRWSSSLSFNI